MRSKTLVSKPKLCRSPHPVKPLRARFPVPEPRDENVEDASGMRKIGIGEIGSGNQSKEDDGLTVNSHDGLDVRVETCDNTGKSGDSMDGDWLEREACIKCDEVGQLLVCSVSSCPVAVHEKCLAFKPRLDDLGNFRCPYCWYKLAVGKKQELRKELMLAKKALSDFISFKVVEDDREKMKDGKAKDHETGIEDEEPAEPSNTCCMEEEIVVKEDERGTIENEEQVHPEAAENTIFSTKEDTGMKVPADDSDMSEASDSETQAPSAHRKPTKHRREVKLDRKNVDPLKKSSPSIRKTLDRRAKNQSKEEITYKRAGQHPESSCQMIVVSTDEKRKRARWTAEEEDILKKGVLRFSSDMNVNFPWRRVLEFGRGVFNSNRTSSDLKDKWRKIIAKGSPGGKNVLL